MKLQDKVCIITGAGSGIGRAMALRFAQEGARLVLTDVVPERVEEVTAAVREAGAVATGVVGDISSDADVGRVIDAAVRDFQRIDVLCNNAGIMDRFVPLDQVTDEHWEKVLGINLEGAFFACRRAIPIMLEQGGGAIVNTASAAALAGGRGGAAYTVSKHGLLGLTRHIAWFYGPKGIRANAICPGAITTGIGVGGEPNPAGFERMRPHFRTVPPPAEAGEVAGAALFLASGDSSYVNGAALAVDGGWLAF
jgi:NAD(P)-dependent dehydrogenase (short-subunit alcohol dehydrogenase family)